MKNIKFGAKTKIVENREICPDGGNYAGQFFPLKSVNENGNLEIFSEDESYSGGSCDCWFSCREEFHQEYFNDAQKLKYLIFSHNQKFKELKSCLADVENLLRVPATKQSKVFALKPKHALVQISDWWNANVARQEFFTILLRAGTKYDLKNRENKNLKIEKALNSEKYFSDTWEAVRAFLSGKTKLSRAYRHFYGWNETFCRLEDDEIKNILKK